MIDIETQNANNANNSNHLPTIIASNSWSNMHNNSDASTTNASIANAITPNTVAIKSEVDQEIEELEEKINEGVYDYNKMFDTEIDVIGTNFENNSVTNKESAETILKRINLHPYDPEIISKLISLLKQKNNKLYEAKINKLQEIMDKYSTTNFGMRRKVKKNKKQYSR
jgi:hypothetical protein